MKLRALILAIAIPAALPSAAEAVYKPFKLPSNKIFCAYMKGSGLVAQVRCQANFLNDAAGVVKVRGRARFVHVTDTVADPDAPVLRYGRTRRFGKLRCSASRKRGVRCRSTRSHHGFFLSRERQGTF